MELETPLPAAQAAAQKQEATASKVGGRGARGSRAPPGSQPAAHVGGLRRYMVGTHGPCVYQVVEIYSSLARVQHEPYIITWLGGRAFPIHYSMSDARRYSLRATQHETNPREIPIRPRAARAGVLDDAGLHPGPPEGQVCGGAARSLRAGRAGWLLGAPWLRCPPAPARGDASGLWARARARQSLQHLSPEAPTPLQGNSNWQGLPLPVAQDSWVPE